MPKLILSPRYTPDSNQLWNAAIGLGWSVERLYSHHAPDYLRGESLVLYGEGLFIRIIADQLGLAMLETPADWLPKLPAEYLRREVTLTTLREVSRDRFPKFVKPAVDKTFEATVYFSDDDLPASPDFDETTPVLVADPVEWGIEVRCFVLEGQVQTASAYRMAGQSLAEADWVVPPSDLPAALDFANAVLSDARGQYPPAFVLDVGMIIGKGWAVVESNPVWASGLYGADPEQVLRVLDKSCWPKESLPVAYQRWVID